MEASSEENQKVHKNIPASGLHWPTNVATVGVTVSSVGCHRSQRILGTGGGGSVGEFLVKAVGGGLGMAAVKRSSGF